MHVVADAGHDVLQDAPARRVEEHVVGDDGRHAGLRGQVRQLVQAERVVRPPAQRQRQIAAVAERLAQPPEAEGAFIVRAVRHEDGDQALAVGDEIAPVEIALAPCRRVSCRATAAGTDGNRPAGRSDRPARTMPSARSSRQPTTRRTPVVFAASWARTMPASELRSTIAERLDAQRGRRANSSSQEDAPRRKREMRGAPAARRSARRSPEDPVQEPALGAGHRDPRHRRRGRANTARRHRPRRK